MLFKRFSLIAVIFIVISFVAINCGDKEPVKNKAYYFDKGKKYFNNGQFENAAESFKTVLNDFQGNIYRAESLFFVGYIYANEVKQPKSLEIAEKYYTMLLEEFPSHELCPSAKVEIDNLGKNPEDIIFPMKKDSTK